MSSELTTCPSPDNISSTHDMSASSEHSVLQSLLENAVKKYENQVGTSLTENYFAIRLGTCDTIESVTDILEERAQAFRAFRGDNRHSKIMKSLKRAVHVLHTIFTSLSVAVPVGQGVGSTVRLNVLMGSVLLSDAPIPQAFPPAKLIFAALGILLAVCRQPLYCAFL
jgi:hypothetical protein